MRECFSWAVTAPPALHSVQTLGWIVCMLMTKVRNVPGVCDTSHSLAHSLLKAWFLLLRFREQVMNTSWGRAWSRSAGRLFDCEGVDRAGRCFDGSVSFIWVRAGVLQHLRCYFQQALSPSHWEFLQTCWYKSTEKKKKEKSCLYSASTIYLF